MSNGFQLICTLVITLILTNTVLANYQPPKNPSRPKTPTGTNSSRTNECIKNTQTTLTAIAPFSHVGQTVSLQPTLAWFIPNSETREIQFSIYEYADSKSKLIYRKQMQSSSGIMKLSLANEKTNLSVGKKYLWQVALLCNPNRPSEDLLVRAEIEVVPMPLDLQNQISQTKEVLKRSELYAKQGFWYDALTELLNNSLNKESTLKLLAELSNLELEAAKKTPEPNRQKNLQQQALQLQQIIKSEEIFK
jgi:hypothetical protein